MQQPDLNLDIAKLAVKFLEDDLTAGESDLLEAWIAETEDHQKIWEHLTNADYLEGRMKYWNNRDQAAYWDRLASEISGRGPVWRIVFRKTLRYAAIFLPVAVILAAGLYYRGTLSKKDSRQTGIGLAGIHIMPRGKVAQLVLASGRVVDLNDSLRSSLTEKDGTRVRNQASALSYAPARGHSTTKTLYNTLSTPRGGEYQVTLSDGTKVWLNAASSLRFPTQFNEKERKVYLSGEAYFEVAKDEEHPFVVSSGPSEITVLGTHFNVKAYEEDPGEKITLAEGSIRVHDAGTGTSGTGIILNPGYEAILIKDRADISVNKANVEAALAWKNGLFLFDSQSLGSIMRTLSRWYDVEVVYDDGVDTKFHFTGRIRKYENITGILRLLELTGKVEFSMKGHTLEVIPKRT